MNKIQLVSEGVLVLASSKGLIAEYQNKEFDYNFPEGIKNVLYNNAIICLHTPDGDNLIIDELENIEFVKQKYDRIIEQYIEFDIDDELLIISHADFTMLCDKGGDYTKYGWPIEKLKIPDSGSYKISIGVKNVSDKFEKYSAYFLLTLSIDKFYGDFNRNTVIEIV